MRLLFDRNKKITTVRFIFFILLSTLGCSSHVVATSYYLSNKGDDIQDGKTKITPWRSLMRLSQAMQTMQRNDSIWFERGSVFKGTIEILSDGIYIGAYGTGPKPVIDGSTEIKNWRYAGENVWIGECKDFVTEPDNLLIDGKVHLVGRYPNKGYLTLSSSSQNEMLISDVNLPFDDGYWDNAEVVVRSSRWTIDNLPTTKYRHKTFYASQKPSYPLQNGFGYFIQKHLSTLDQHGEWFFKTGTGQIFLYLNSDVKPNRHKIEVSFQNTGIKMFHRKNINVENITCTNQRIGIHAEDCVNTKLKNISILNSSRNGLEIISCIESHVENSLIADSNNNGVEWKNNNGGLFSNNTILRTGLHPGLGLSGNGTYIALNITSDNSITFDNLFQYNIIDSTGYIGIDFRSGNTHIINNLIKNFCITKDDGGGIYTWGNSSDGNIIEGNIILNGIGSGEGTLNIDQLFVNGIYIDDKSSHILIRDNTVSKCATSGIFLHNAKAITLSENILFDNAYNISNKERGQLYIKLDTLGQFGGNTDLHLVVTQNKLVAVDETSYCMYLSAESKSHLKRLGSFAGNYFIATRNNQAVVESYNQSGLCSAPDELALSEWQSTNGRDGSIFKALPASSHSQKKDLVENGNLTTNADGWIAWPEKSSIVWERHKAIDGHSLKVIPSDDYTDVLLYNGGMSFDKNKLYRLTFTAVTEKPSKIEFVPLMAKSPWGALGDYACFSIDSTYRTFTYFFKPHKSNATARINFKSNRIFWIDNISLQEVVKDEKDKVVKLVYNDKKKTKLIYLSKYSDPTNPVRDSLMLPAYQSRVLFIDKFAPNKR